MIARHQKRDGTLPGMATRRPAFRHRLQLGVRAVQDAAVGLWIEDELEGTLSLVCVNIRAIACVEDVSRGEKTRRRAVGPERQNGKRSELVMGTVDGFDP